MLRALRAGAEDVAKLADLALGRLRAKIPQLRLALEGHCTEPHRYRLGRLLSHLGYLERQTEERSGRIAERLDDLLPEAAQQRLDRIPGINRKTIENIRAETGMDMTIFPDEHHLASWWGMGPGNEESAGRRLRSRTRPGNRWLRRALTEAAWAASAVTTSDLRAHYRRLAARRGRKRALVAVGHSLLVILDPVLKDNVEYTDLGPDSFDRLEPERLRRHLVKRLQALGYDVTLSPKDPHDSAA
jgi:transposase